MKVITATLLEQNINYIYHVYTYLGAISLSYFYVIFARYDVQLSGIKMNMIVAANYQ